MCSCARIGLPAATRLGAQPDAARGAAHQLDHALARQGLQMLLGGVGRFEAELAGDFGPRRRGAGALDGALHQLEDLLLAVGEFRRFVHWASLERTGRPTLPGQLTIHPVPVFSSSFTKNAKQ